jgi:hypothetical protein
LDNAYNFFLRNVISGSPRGCWGSEEINIVMTQAEINLNSFVHRRLPGLEISRWSESISTNFLKIDSRGHDFDIIHAELRALSHN